MGATRAVSETLFTLQAAAVANGNGSVFNVEGCEAVLVQLTGTGTWTVNWEVTLDGTNYVSVPAAPFAGSASSTTATAAGLFVVPTMGAGLLRARVSGWGSGSVTAVGRGLPPGVADVAGSLRGGGTTAGSNSDTAGTGVKSNVSGSASSVTLLASNSSRKRFHLFNDSASKCRVDLTGGTASATSFSVILEPYTGAGFSYFEGPQPVNTGAITGIWDTATGTMRVTEFA